MGWGKLGLVEANSDFSEIRLKLLHSFECEGLKSPHPHGQFSGGLIAGATERLLGRPVYCEEEKCVAVGDDECVFKVSTR